MKYKKIIVLLILVLLTACNSNLTDSEKFKQEYEKYNKTNIKLEISDDNIIKYQTKDEINNIIKNNTGVIFIGSPKDNKSRLSIKYLLDASESTDLKEIYYIDKIEEIEVDNLKTPTVIFVLEGKIIKTISNEKEKLNEEEEIDLYNDYLENIHEVLQDTCNEEC